MLVYMSRYPNRLPNRLPNRQSKSGFRVRTVVPRLSKIKTFVAINITCPRESTSLINRQTNLEPYTLLWPQAKIQNTKTHLIISLPEKSRYCKNNHKQSKLDARRLHQTKPGKHLFSHLSRRPARRIQKRCHIRTTAKPIPAPSRIIILQNSMQRVFLEEKKSQNIHTHDTLQVLFYGLNPSTCPVTQCLMVNTLNAGLYRVLLIKIVCLGPSVFKKRLFLPVYQ